MCVGYGMVEIAAEALLGPARPSCGRGFRSHRMRACRFSAAIRVWQVAGYARDRNVFHDHRRGV
jgi:hypothetical protein